MRTLLNRFMGVPLPRPAALAARLETPIEEWPYLDSEVLLKTRSRKVCMTCHWFRHHAGVNCIPVLTCHAPEGLGAGGGLSAPCTSVTGSDRRSRPRKAG